MTRWAADMSGKPVGDRSAELRLACGNYDVFAQVDYVSSQVCKVPQVFYLETLLSYLPHACFVLNTRPTDTWLSSVRSWRSKVDHNDNRSSLMTRLIGACPIHPKNETGLGDWYDMHKLRASLALRSANCGLEFNIEDGIGPTTHLDRFFKINSSKECLSTYARKTVYMNTSQTPPPSAATQADVESDEGILIFTLANQEFVHILRNFLLHMRANLPLVAFEAHAADNATMPACDQIVRLPATCVYSPFSAQLLNPMSYCADSPADYRCYYSSTFYRYKTQLLLTVLSRARSAVIMLDATALVTSTTCLREWIQYPEDIVISASFGSPAWFAARFRIVPNTGAVLVRVRARNVWERMLQLQLNQTDGMQSQQPRLCRTFEDGGFKWSVEGPRFGQVANITVDRAPLLARFLDPERWPRSVNSSTSNTCLYHPFTHSNRVERFARDGWWYLSDQSMRPPPPATAVPLARLATAVPTNESAFMHAAALLSTREHGHLAPPGRSGNSRYYKHVFNLLLEHGMSASDGVPQSVVDIGSGAPPFLEHISFLPDRTILAPFFRMYDSSAYNSTEEQMYVAPPGIYQITTDFLDWAPARHWGIALCMQTLEHVPSPGAFLAKLRQISDITIISVPYRWQDYKKVEHLHHNISEETVHAWVKQDRRLDSYVEPFEVTQSVITEADSRKTSTRTPARIVLVFFNTLRTP